MYVVVGANGYLGSYIVKNILTKTNEQVIATARTLNHVLENNRVEWQICDVQNDNDVNRLVMKIGNVDEDVKLVYLAAFHHPDKVEQNQFLAWEINVVSLARFINRMAGVVKCAYYASTDSVYGESIDGYRFKEEDMLRPVNFYGHSKCAAESLMVHRGFNVVRFPFLISPSIIYKPHFYDTIVASLGKGKKFEMYMDSYRSSLSFDNAGWLLVELMERDNVPQILNVCGDRDLSKYEVGLKIAERENLDSNLVIPVSIQGVRQENFRVERATSTLMDNSKIKDILGLEKIDIFENPKFQ
jgi:dTDP-4-dehydrorhamnose reductase